MKKTSIKNDNVSKNISYSVAAMPNKWNCMFTNPFIFKFTLKGNNALMVSSLSRNKSLTGVLIVSPAAGG